MEFSNAEGLNVELVNNFYNEADSDRIFLDLYRLPFETPTYSFNGRRIQTRRQVLGYGDVAYPFSGTVVRPLPWTPLMQKLREDVEARTGAQYNFALLNLYNDGLSTIATHKDDERCLDAIVPIPTLSFRCYTYGGIYESESSVNSDPVRAWIAVCDAAPHQRTI